MSFLERAESTLDARMWALCLLLVCFLAAPAHGFHHTLFAAAARAPLEPERPSFSAVGPTNPGGYGIADSSALICLTADSGQQSIPDAVPEPVPTNGLANDGGPVLQERALFRQAYGSKAGETGFRQDLDLNGDGIIDSEDRYLLRKRYRAGNPD